MQVGTIFLKNLLINCLKWMHKDKRTPEQIREEMAQLKALRPDWCRSAQDWLKIHRFNELYAEWIEALSNTDE